MPEFGLIHVYTGNGKGKTSAAFGLAFRACGHGFKVCMLQFMSGLPSRKELKSVELLPELVIIQIGRNYSINLNNPASIDVELAQKGWNMAKNILAEGQYQLVILDEINLAMACKLISAQEVAEYLTKLDRISEIVLTGPNAPQELIAIADLVTEIK